MDQLPQFPKQYALIKQTTAWNLSSTHGMLVWNKMCIIVILEGGGVVLGCFMDHIFLWDLLNRDRKYLIMERKKEDRFATKDT